MSRARNFTGELMDRYSDLNLIDYGFVEKVVYCFSQEV